jgi:hypothetical protein
LEILDVKLAVPHSEPPPDSKAKPESLAIGRIAGHLKWQHKQL